MNPSLRIICCLTALASLACEPPAEANQGVDPCNDPAVCGGGACTAVGESFQCACPAGAEAGPGERCRDIDECLTLGSDVACGVAGATCSNRDGTYECVGCPSGWERQGIGQPCKEAVAPDICARSPSLCGMEGATCTAVGESYQCACPAGAEAGPGERCRDTDECLAGAEALCGVAGATCTNRTGSYECTVCPSGWTKPLGYGLPCTDKDECADAAPCGIAGATCNNSAGSFTCECPAGYASEGPGKPCVDVNECAAPMEAVCGVAGASCSNRPGTFECVSCPQGWTTQGPGLQCADADECSDVLATCLVEGATCNNDVGSFACDCPDGYATPSAEGAACYDIDECEDSTFCEALCTNTAGSAMCESTVADVNSPYWRYACDIADGRYVDNPTYFEMECRCPHTQIGRPDDPSHPDYEAFLRCNAVTTTADYDIGSGPSVRSWRRSQGADLGATYLNGGFLDAAERTLYVGTQWKDNQSADGNPEFTYYGAILAVDVDWGAPTVGDRRLVSGYTLDGTRGAGPTLRAVKDIKRGSDGKLYTMSWESGHPVQMMRIDPTTGDRVLVWKENPMLHGDGPVPASQCTNGSTVGVDAITNGSRYTQQMVLTGQNLTLAPNGDFFLGVSQNGPAKGPRGIVRISADGSTCTWVTRFGASNGNRYAARAPGEQGADYGLAAGTGPLGEGPNNFGSNPVNMFYREDDAGVAWLYALDGIGSGGTGTRYYRVNIATGDRESLFSSIIGDSHSVWDPEREVLWTSGGFDTTRVVALDIIGHDGAGPTELGGLRCLATTSDWYKCMRGPGDVDNQNRGGTFFDPLDNNLVIAHGSWGLVRVEVATGNTYVFSR